MSGGKIEGAFENGTGTRLDKDEVRAVVNHVTVLLDMRGPAPPSMDETADALPVKPQPTAQERAKALLS